MIDDRDYMRQPEYRDSGWTPRFRFRWSWTAALLTVYVVVFLAKVIAEHFYPANLVFYSRIIPLLGGVKIIPGYLPLSLEGIEHGYCWQFITYQFLHAGVFHLAMNCWMIYLFGRELEHLLGVRKFLVLMFTSGIVGGVFQMVAAWIWPLHFGGPVLGASACAYGLTAAFVLMYPDMEMQLVLIPIRIRAKTLLIGLIVVELAGFVFPDVIMPGVGHVAHLGGMAMGWFFVRKILQGDWSRLTGALRPVEKGKPVLRQPTLEPLEEKSATDFVASEVDPILDKLSAHGILSLTPREREILEAARQKMAKR